MNKTNLFKTKINQHRFLEAAAIAESLVSGSKEVSLGWDEISAFLRSYHGKLYSLTVPPNLNNRVIGEFQPVTENLQEENIVQESLRVTELLEKANKYFDYELILECYKGYYALINQDGLRACIQLYRSIILAESINPDFFADLRSNLKSIIDQSIGLVEVENGTIILNESYPFSIYVEFDRFVQRISSLLDIDLMDRFNLYKPYLLIDG
jgi:hypothetical protein